MAAIKPCPTCGCDGTIEGRARATTSDYRRGVLDALHKAREQAEMDEASPDPLNNNIRADEARIIELRIRALLTIEQVQGAPIDMILFCPVCMEQHIDRPEPEIDWTNPPHKSHLCHKCRTIWRPADVPTNGVAQTATKGSADTWGVPCPSLPAPPVPVTADEER